MFDPAGAPAATIREGVYGPRLDASTPPEVLCQSLRGWVAIPSALGRQPGARDQIWKVLVDEARDPDTKRSPTLAGGSASSYATCAAPDASAPRCSAKNTCSGLGGQLVGDQGRRDAVGQPRPDRGRAHRGAERPLNTNSCPGGIATLSEQRAPAIGRSWSSGIRRVSRWTESVEGPWSVPPSVVASTMPRECSRRRAARWLERQPPRFALVARLSPSVAESFAGGVLDPRRTLRV